MVEMGRSAVLIHAAIRLLLIAAVLFGAWQLSA
jgi:hypothetical protein